ncbi:MAG: type II toxin-antitoxin system RelE/ParE family toxin [Rhizobium rhizophilum]
MTAYRIVLTADAVTDRETIYRYTRDQFGPAQARRYDGFLDDAIASLALNPKRTGSKPRSEIAEGIRSLRLAIAGNAPGQSRASHVILYFEHTGNRVVISRILHESMDLQRHVRDLPTRDEPERNEDHER